MKTLIAGPSSFVQLKQLVGEQSSASGELDDVLVILIRPDEDFTCREVRRTKDGLIFFGYPNELGKYRAVPISDGDEFRCEVLVTTSVAQQRITDFSEHLR